MKAPAIDELGHLLSALRRPAAELGLNDVINVLEALHELCARSPAFRRVAFPWHIPPDADAAHVGPWSRPEVMASRLLSWPGPLAPRWAGVELCGLAIWLSAPETMAAEPSDRPFATGGAAAWSWGDTALAWLFL